MKSNLATKTSPGIGGQKSRGNTPYKKPSLPTEAEAKELIKSGKAIALGVSVNGRQQYHYTITKRFAATIIYNNITEEVINVRKYFPPFPDLTNSHLFIGRDKTTNE